jgi:hypothetical protein
MILAIRPNHPAIRLRWRIPRKRPLSVCVHYLSAPPNSRKCSVPVEKRTRVEIFLPIRSDLADYQAITDWLAEELAYARGGSTLTTPFTGLYVSTSHNDIIRDSIQVLFCDFDLDTQDEKHGIELTSYLEGLRGLTMEALSEEEVWITYYPIMRITDHRSAS